MIRALARAARDAEATNATALVDTSMMTTATSLRAYASAASAQPLLVTMIGVHKPLNEVHRKIEAAGAEIKESRRQTRRSLQQHVSRRERGRDGD